MNNTTLPNIARFVLLVLLQVLIFNNINFMGYVNPYPYVWFVLLLPFNIEQWKVIFYAFLIGITIDVFEDSGGMNAAATLMIAYLRPLILRFSFGLSYEYQTIKFYQTTAAQKMLYITLMVVVHHLMLFVLEVFNLDQIGLILKKTLFSGIFTLILLFLFTLFFKKKK